MNDKVVTIQGAPLTLEAICAVASQQSRLVVSENTMFMDRINKGSAFVDQLLKEEGFVYGVTTGFGDSCTVSIPKNQVMALSKHLYSFHGCGTGAYFTPSQTRAILAVRLNSLAQGYSGVRYQ